MITAVSIYADDSPVVQLSGYDTEYGRGFVIVIFFELIRQPGGGAEF